jgi:hypothetical protein
MTGGADESRELSELVSRSAFEMRRREASPVTTGTVTGQWRTRWKELEQFRNARLLKTNDESLECGVAGHLLDRGVIPTRPILKNATVGGEYESGAHSGVEHESVIFSQQRVARTIRLSLPKRVQNVIRQMEPHYPPAQRTAVQLRPH